MPGRKSNVSTTSNAAGDDSEIAAVPKSASKEGKEKDGMSVDDISLPKSMIARLAKGVLPPNTQIHRDALLALHKSATVFVSYVASNSNEAVQATGKKTIQPQDVIASLKDAEFETFIPRLEAELKKYNDTQCDKRNNYRRKVKEEKAATAPPKDGGLENGSTNAATPPTNGHAENGDTDDARPFKKFRTENGVGISRDDADDADIEDDDQDADDQEDDDVEDDNVEDEEVFEDAEEAIHQDDTMDEGVEDTFDGRGGTRDEALDEALSD